jgi:hypothetical protein
MLLPERGYQPRRLWLGRSETRVTVIHSARAQTTEDRDAPARGGAYRRGARELDRWYKPERASRIFQWFLPAKTANLERVRV